MSTSAHGSQVSYASCCIKHTQAGGGWGGHGAGAEALRGVGPWVPLQGLSAQHLLSPFAAPSSSLRLSPRWLPITSPRLLEPAGGALLLPGARASGQVTSSGSSTTRATGQYYTSQTQKTSSA